MALVALVGGSVAEDDPPPEHFFVDRANAADKSAEVHILIRQVAATDLNSLVHTHARSFSPVHPCVCAAEVTQSEAHWLRPSMIVEEDVDGGADDVGVAEDVGVADDVGVVEDDPPPEHFLVDRANAADKSAEVHLLIRQVAATDLNSFVHTHARSFSPVHPCVCAAEVTQSDAH